jgi:hypothetical protein
MTFQLITARSKKKMKITTFKRRETNKVKGELKIKTRTKRRNRRKRGLR